MSRVIEELEIALAEAVERSRSNGRPELCFHRGPIQAPPSSIDVFERAEAEGADRFLLSCPARGFELVGVGASHTYSGATAVSSALAGSRDQAPPDAIWVGGFAFDPTPPRARAPHWEPFGAARIALPELAILQRPEGASLAVARFVTPDSDPERELERLLGWLEKPGPRAIPRAPLGLGAVPGALESYRRAVREVLRQIRAGCVEKVVIACEELHRIPPEFEVGRSLRALGETHPAGVTFAQGLGDATFLGATPELLIRRSGASIESAAVAATTRRAGSARAEAELARALCASSKEREEHALVVDSLRRALGDLCTSLEIPSAPEVMNTGTLQHLHTPVRGELCPIAGRSSLLDPESTDRESVVPESARPFSAPRSSAPRSESTGAFAARSEDTPSHPHVLELMSRLHPTPALGGFPHAKALELIRTLEGFDRGWYAGPIGWFDGRGDGELFVALRCALATPDALRIFAGSGLVRDSDPEQEASETSLKLGSIRGALDPW